MTNKDELLQTLLQIADYPENEFDKFIKENKDTLNIMSEKHLSYIYQVRKRAKKLCSIIPYTREEIQNLIASKEVSVYNLVAQLEDQYNIADYYFTISRGEKY
jgi:DNA-directed RNA polymerase subunit F